MSSLFWNDRYVFPRPPLKAVFEALLPNGNSVQFLLIDVHLKAGRSNEDEARRRQAMDALKLSVDDFLAASPESKVVDRRRFRR